MQLHLQGHPEGRSLLWVQVLRQLATSAGLGRKRPKLKRDDKDKLGTEGEDIIADEAGSLKLRLPARSACTECWVRGRATWLMRLAA